MNITQTYKVVCSLVVLVGATLRSSGNCANPNGIKNPNSSGGVRQAASEDSGNRQQAVRSSHYSFEGYSENATKISISSQGIRFIGRNIKRLVKLERLDLSRNKLETLPPEIGELKNLKILCLHGNKLKSLPDSIGELENLQYLDLSGNKLESLPAEMKKLTNLQYLDLSNNKFETLPPDMGKWKSLRNLYLNNNKFKSLPPEIGELENLQELDLHGNEIEALPDTTRKLSGSLKFLDLRDNSISEEGERGSTLGRRELRDIFKACVKFDGDVLQGPQ
ncbi:uncharacterized protein VICG_00948 [Vittaforma corneae ATCC 50505]|uniref:Uncharacterized protein n=1 Tax=Vittaforma corneae (strain ATCC 50505) TaxID=993615 RepID=L2GM62_VITCO|nr:uncharacterized protein VICG_00948 [Vittaforma corneae ATCC 50505]ELA41931.1 hypothetical protein VICG_00948 [Vittaforma corneae ATCC 50505]